MKQIIVEWTVLWNVQQISGVGEQYKYKTYNTMIEANKCSTDFWAGHIIKWPLCPLKTSN